MTLETKGRYSPSLGMSEVIRAYVVDDDYLLVLPELHQRSPHRDSASLEEKDTPVEERFLVISF